MKAHVPAARPLGVVLIGLLLGLPTWPVRAADVGGAQDYDVIVRRDGTRVMTKITKEDYVSVDGNVEGLETKEPSYRIAEIIRSGSDDLYLKARDYQAQSNHLTAVKCFGLRWILAGSLTADLVCFSFAFS